MAASLLLLVNAGSTISARELADRRAGRYFADVSVALHFAERGEFPVASYRVRHTSWPRATDAEFHLFRDELLRRTQAAGLHSWKPLGRIPSENLDEVRVIVPRADDAGRALLLGQVFRVWGLAPYLLFWLGPCLAAAILCWASAEFLAAGRPVAALTFGFGIALSAYVLDALALDYSAVGFYLIAVLLAVPVGTYCTRERRTVRGALLRAAVAGMVWGVCSLARSSALLTLPALVVAILACFRGLAEAGPALEISARRARHGFRVAIPHNYQAGVLALLLLLGPYVALRLHTAALVARTSATYGLIAAQNHDVWLSLWEGLGDFDRTRGHYWLDEEAQKVIGGDRLLMSPASDKIFKGEVLESIRAQPLWYATILAKRLVATVTQYKLWPWGPLGGASSAPAKSRHEGAIDAYYSLTAQADWFGLGLKRIELPWPLLLLFPAALLAYRAARAPQARAWEWCDTVQLSLVALAAIAMPVAVTTAGGTETQAFMVFYVLAVALCADRLAKMIARSGPPGQDSRKPDGTLHVDVVSGPNHPLPPSLASCPPR